MKTLIVNFYGGPGTGKSTMAARVFSELKEMGLNVELATEYAKDLTWQESFEVLANQLYVFAKQQHRIWRLNGKVQIILTDAPLLISLVYGKETSRFFGAEFAGWRFFTIGILAKISGKLRAEDFRACGKR